MTPLRPHKPILGLGAALLLYGMLAGIWEVLACQAPGTSLFIGMLPGPISALRELAFSLGLLLLITSLLLGWSGRRAPSWLVALLHVGAWLCVGAQTYGAAHGMPGVQVVDFRPGVRPLFVTKFLALALFCLALIELGRRILSGAQAPQSGVETSASPGVAQLDSEDLRH